MATPKQVLMVYHGADNGDLKEAMYENYVEMSKNYASLGDNVEVYMLADFSSDLGPEKKYQDKLVKFTSSGVEVVLEGDELYTKINGEDSNKIDLATSRGETLANFVDYVQEIAPEAEYSLLMNDHGAAIGGAVCDDHPDTEEAQDSEPMSLRDQRDAIAGKNIKSVIYDCCIMSTAETAIILGQAGVEQVAGSEESVESEGLNYTLFFSNLAKAGRGECTVAEAFYSACESSPAFFNATLMDTTKAEDLRAGMDDFAELANSLDNDGFQLLAAAVIESAYFGVPDGSPLTNAYSGSDFGMFLNRVKYYFQGTDLEVSADNLLTLLTDMRTANCATDRYLQYFGISTYLPTNDEPDEYSAERLDIGENWLAFTNRLATVEAVPGIPWVWPANLKYETLDLTASGAEVYHVANLTANTYFTQTVFTENPAVADVLYSFTPQSEDNTICITAADKQTKAVWNIYKFVDNELVAVKTGISIGTALTEYKFTEMDVKYYISIETQADDYFYITALTDPVSDAEKPEQNRTNLRLTPYTNGNFFEFSFEFANGTSIGIQTKITDISIYSVVDGSKLTISEKNEEDAAVRTLQTPKLSAAENTPENIAGVRDSMDDFFFAQTIGVWSEKINARHAGSFNDWRGTDELVAIAGKNRFSTYFTGSLDTTKVFLTDSSNGDAFFLDDKCVGGTQARIDKISSIIAGAGDDVVDLTSYRYAYNVHREGMKVHGGEGDDVIWANGGKNMLAGDEGNDTIYGGVGNDIFAGGAGDDTFRSFGGHDIFCYGSEFDWGNDRIIAGENDDISIFMDGITAEDVIFNGAGLQNSTMLFWGDSEVGGSIELVGMTFADVSLFFDGSETIFSGEYNTLKESGFFAASTNILA